MSQTAVSDAGSPGLRLSSARGRWVVTATVLGSGLAALDATVVGIALPAIGRDFHAGVSSLQWVVDAYTLTLAGLLLLGGTLGDSYGRRKMFVIGTVWFAIASLLCGLAPNVAVLIAARALQGVGGALLTPGSLAILQASFAEQDRGAAIGAWSGLGGVATAIGPFIGGWLISAVSWRLVFFINLPLAVVVVAAAARHVPETKSPGPVPRLDIKGAVCISGALAGITYGLIAASSYGWGAVPVLLPPGYSRRQRYPVYYLLHGMPGDPSHFLSISGMDVRLNNQISLHPRAMILVYPDGQIGGSSFSDSEWANTSAGAYDSYVIDVLHNVDHRFATLARRQDRVIAGCSAGAYGAVNVALHHLNEFGSVQSWSGYFLQTKSGVFAHANRATLAYNSPLVYARRLRAALTMYPLRAYMIVGAAIGVPPAAADA